MSEEKKETQLNKTRTLHRRNSILFVWLWITGEKFQSYENKKSRRFRPNRGETFASTAKYFIRYADI